VKGECIVLVQDEAAYKPYGWIKWIRFTLVVFALLNVAAHLFASPGATKPITFWLEIEVAVYLMVGVIYLLGLRFWYGPAVLFSVFNLFVYMLSGLVAIPLLSAHPLTGHVEFLKYSFGRGFSLLSWLYLIIVGAWMMARDRGSKVNELLRNS
jgi:hypothetical protein